MLLLLDSQLRPSPTHQPVQQIYQQAKVSTSDVTTGVLFNDTAYYHAFNMTESRQVLFLSSAYSDLVIDITDFGKSASRECACLQLSATHFQRERRSVLKWSAHDPAAAQLQLQAVKSPCGTGPVPGREVSTLKNLQDDITAAAYHNYMIVDTW